MSAAAAEDAAPAVAPFAASEGAVAVRMYRQGLGDCFLLAFPTANPAQSYYVLIDCGVLTGTPGGSALLKRVAADILDATGGQIHLLVVTHRHWDHIAGFSLASDVFQRMTVHNLWLPWLENQADDAVRKLWKRTGEAINALAMAVSTRPLALRHLVPVLEFMGEDRGLAAASGDPLAPVRKLLKPGGQLKYCRPGDGPLALPPVPGLADAGGARIFVLGPPTSETDLARMDPTSGGHETYLTGSQVVTRLGVGMAMEMEPEPGEQDDSELRPSSPFDPRLSISADEAVSRRFFFEHYGFSAGDRAGTAGADASGPSSGTTTSAIGSRASDAGSATAPPPAPRPDSEAGGAPGADQAAAGQAAPAAPAAQPVHRWREGAGWRRLDPAWMADAEALALQLDNTINNTSLVLAFELVKSRKVLLFVGDAQVGNWLSWNGLSWQREDGSAVTTADLLGRTILYKVGHHGSHNATVRARDGKPWGLELMTSPELVALLPVDEVFARQEPREWMMPWDNMLNRLTELTHGRILRVDQGVPAQPPDRDPAEWQSFLARVEPRQAPVYPPGVPDPKHPGKLRREAVTLDALYLQLTVPEA